MLRCVVERQPVEDAPRLGGRECLVSAQRAPAAPVWVFRLSSTTRITAASGYHSSTNRRITAAKSRAVRCAVTMICRLPACGSKQPNRLQVPMRRYS